MKSQKSLEAAQREMRQRQRQPRGAGRPPLPISPQELVELWGLGYSPRGMAIHFGCDERTIMSRLTVFFPDGLKLQFLSDHLLYHLAMTSENAKFLIAFLRRDERRQYRRTGEHAGDRSHTAIMEYECQLIRQINEAKNRLEELQQMAEGNEKST